MYRVRKHISVVSDTAWFIINVNIFIITLCQNKFNIIEN